MYEDLSCLFAPLEATSEFGALTDALSRPGAALACGLDDAQKLHLTVAAARKLGRPLLFVTSNEVAAQRVREDLNALLGGGAALLPARDVSFVRTAASSRELTGGHGRSQSAGDERRNAPLPPDAPRALFAERH